VHTLAVQSGTVAALRILHQDRLWMICATAPHGHTCPPSPIDSESTARTATGRVLYATQPADSGALPDYWTPHEWRQIRDRIRDLHATVVDYQEAYAGICCVSAPVWWPNGTCAGAVTAILRAAKPTPTLPDLVTHAARRIGEGLLQNINGG
jgi:DNA-binding IclR family transcriptional regulator